jgi:epoxyqueuosine reductase
MAFLNTYIENLIIDFTIDSNDNSLGNGSSQKSWDKPIVGFSKGNDFLYSEIKKNIGEKYWTPKDVIEIAFPKEKIIDEEIHVISWILPKTYFVKNKNRNESKKPSKEWVKAKIYGEKFNRILREHVVHVLTKKGYKAIAPILIPDWKWEKNSEHGYISNWSERHTAFVSGLGTFGLCEGLITPLGKAVRIGSVVTNAPLEITERKYSNYHEYCLYFSKGICKACEKRCPSGAIKNNKHDKLICREYIKSIVPECEELYNLKINEYSCGLCQTKVPCESQIPVNL